MNRQDPDILDFYDYEMTLAASRKHGMDPLEALRRFVGSKTYALLLDADCGMASFGAPAVFDIWETEMATGDPRNSIHVRSE